jgi:uncharacterized protein (DUF1697 family)
MVRKTYIAILRGINVSGSNVIKMKDLSGLFEDSGFEDVRTYIQSGNVLFNYPSTDTGELARGIEGKIVKEFGMNVPVNILELRAVKDVLEQNPFLVDMAKDISKLHVTLLSDDADKERVDKIETEKYLPDEFIVVGRAIYIYCPNGYGRTKLTNNFFENKLKVSATTRNWKTIMELVRLGEELAGKN